MAKTVDVYWDFSSPFAYLGATQAKALLATVRPRDVVGRTRRKLAAELIAELNDLFGGFKERARIVQKTLRSDDVAFVLVTSPAPMSIREVLYFAERLHESGMRAGSIVVNRMRVAPDGGAPVTVAEAKAAILEGKLVLDEDASERVAQAHADAFKLASLDASHLRLLEGMAGNTPIIRIAERPIDVNDVSMLLTLGELMLAGGE